MERPSNPTCIYLDSCILISHLNGEDPLTATPLIKLIEAGQFRAAISGLHYTEVLGKRRNQTPDPKIEAQAIGLIEHTGWQMIDLGADVLYRARQCAINEGLKPMDAIHVAAAIVGECDVLMTSDAKLTSRYGNQRRIEGVWITSAYVPGAQALPGLLTVLDDTDDQVASLGRHTRLTRSGVRRFFGCRVALAANPPGPTKILKRSL